MIMIPTSITLKLSRYAYFDFSNLFLAHDDKAFLGFRDLGFQTI